MMPTLTPRQRIHRQLVPKASSRDGLFPINATIAALILVCATIAILDLVRLAHLGRLSQAPRPPQRDRLRAPRRATGRSCRRWHPARPGLRSLLYRRASDAAQRLLRDPAGDVIGHRHPHHRRLWRRLPPDALRQDPGRDRRGPRDWLHRHSHREPHLRLPRCPRSPTSRASQRLSQDLIATGSPPRE